MERRKRREGLDRAACRHACPGAPQWAGSRASWPVGLKTLKNKRGKWDPRCWEGMRPGGSKRVRPAPRAPWDLERIKKHLLDSYRKRALTFPWRSPYINHTLSPETLVLQQGGKAPSRDSITCPSWSPPTPNHIISHTPAQTLPPAKVSSPSAPGPNTGRYDRALLNATLRQAFSFAPMGLFNAHKQPVRSGALLISIFT